MSLISYPETTHQILTSQRAPFLILIIGILILLILKRTLKSSRIKRIKAIDLFPFFAIVAIPILTLNSHGNTLLPILVFVWMLIGLGWILYQVISTGDFVIKKFLIAFWRMSDLYWLILYVISFGIKLIN
ncbi:DUF3397 family protein [Fructilactobacillus sp. Tb1]|uniref:DUF3397 family protein n=1 Tax=Fructilactobacillus sp. Tb1 TaxID=3422304 RepID=UPI003D281513